MAEITKDTIIGELLRMEEAEKVVPLLFEIGMHCIGCPSSQMESVGQAAMVHGIDPDALAEKLNAAANA